MTQQLKNELSNIRTAIDDGSYRAGAWQKLLRELDVLDQQTRHSLRDEVSEVSNALHARHNHLKAAFWPIYLLELILLVTAAWLTSTDQLYAMLLAIFLLALTLQPTIKVTTGLLLGVRYSYAYLWYFEPRFKMRYGDYAACARWRRVLLNLMGSIGTPLAMGIGMSMLQDNSYLYWLCAAGLIGFSLMQLVAFFAALAGLKRVGPMTLRHLTTPATLGFELRQMIG